ncbi:Glycogen-binding subunit 76A [Portunus trituberculatus]|uniref:Glycogen-binding subunit 76A n=1 Tax=Portunus trituberculatus TaxID=210409 RepID=A0A5B7FRI2_PORTR|nr:Glycogen-binding subunit 76A [Portunus trituberculatus]
MPVVYCGRGRGSATKLLPLRNDRGEASVDMGSTSMTTSPTARPPRLCSTYADPGQLWLAVVETSKSVTYCVRTGGEAGPGGGPLPDPARHHTSPFSLDTTCCDDSHDTYTTSPTGIYALLGLSRCWWNYTVTSPPAADDTADVMEEGVATEQRGGTGPEVTGVGWSLPCSLSSLLAMNCRARAEGLARRLQAKVRLGNGGTSAFEQTSLVNPGPDDHYASMDCRHSSLDNPHVDLLEGSSLRPIHVVTSEPTLHMCHQPQPDLVHLHEQDSDVYYDFDLASPDDPADAEEDREKEGQQEGEEQRRQSEGGERPESGCVTSVTSPVMFDDEREDDDEENEDLYVAVDLHRDEDAIACSPDADLRAVRQILSHSSLKDSHDFVRKSADSDAWRRNGECEVVGVRGVHGGRDEGKCECSDGHKDLVGHLGTEGAGAPAHTCTRHPVWVTAPVAKSGSCWCHHAPGTPPAVPRTSAGRLACYATPTLYDAGSTRSNGGPCWGREGSEPCRVEACVMIDNEGQNKDDQGHENTQQLVGESGQPARTLSPTTLQSSSPEGEPAATRGNEEFEAPLPAEEEDALISSPESGGAPEAISGSSPPPPAEPHLYPTSGEECPADMEARDDEADLPPKGEELSLEDDAEVIETLDENEEESEEEANEEDVEEETILTGKFRNIRGYKERVRRLSDEIEDQPLPVTVITYDDESLPEQEDDVAEGAKATEEEAVSGSELASQLSELQMEDVGVQVDTGDEEGEGEASSDEAATRSSSEETDPERIEEYKMRIKRSSSLKCGKTPPGTPGRKKIVRFADMLGLDLAAVRTFLGGGVPHVPRSAFWDLQVEERRSNARAAATSAAMELVERQVGVPRRVLTPLFQPPGLHGNFLERVRTQRVVVESIDVGDDMSVRGVVRVLNLDYHKSVLVRYTFDQWRNYHEVSLR